MAHAESLSSKPKTCVTTDNLAYKFLSVRYRDKIKDLNVEALKQPLKTNHQSFASKKYSFLFEVLDRKISQLVEAGLMDYYIDEYMKKPEPIDETGPVVLTFEHLGVGFKIWLLALFISTFAFCLEHSVRRLLVPMWLKLKKRLNVPSIGMLRLGIRLP